MLSTHAGQSWNRKWLSARSWPSVLVAINFVATVAGIAEPVERHSHHILIFGLSRFVGCGTSVYQLLGEFDPVGALQRHFLSVREQAPGHGDQRCRFGNSDGAVLHYAPFLVVFRRRLRDTKHNIGIRQYDPAHHLFQGPHGSRLINRSLRDGRAAKKQDASESHSSI